MKQTFICFMNSWKRSIYYPYLIRCTCNDSVGTRGPGGVNLQRGCAFLGPKRVKAVSTDGPDLQAVSNVQCRVQ